MTSIIKKTFKTVKRLTITVGGLVILNEAYNQYLEIQRRIQEAKLAPELILEVDLRAPLIDGPSQSFSFGKPTFTETINVLKRAGDDPKVKAVVAHIRTPGTITQTQELRSVFEELTKKGKETVAFGDYLSQNGFYLASAFSKTYMQESGQLDLVGYYYPVPFLKGTLDKLNINATIVKTSEYKTAPNIFSETQLTQKHREEMEHLVGSFYKQLVEGISRGRRINEKQVQELIDRGPFSAAEAAAARLIDGVTFRDDILNDLKIRLGSRAINFKKYSRRPQFLLEQNRSYTQRIQGYSPLTNTVAIIYLRGNIMPFTEKKILRELDIVLNDDSVKACVLRIDSGGGDAVTSDTIGHKVLQLREKGKKVIASVSDMTASGAYLIASQCDEIVANPASIVGSIGVFAVIPHIGNFLKDQLGINVDAVQFGKNAALHNLLSAPDESGMQKLKTFVDTTHKMFIKRVATGRRMPIANVNELATAEVFTGDVALKKGLVDRIGGLADAIEIAKSYAGPGSKVIYPKPKLRDLDSDDFDAMWTGAFEAPLSIDIPISGVLPFFNSNKPTM